MLLIKAYHVDHVCRSVTMCMWWDASSIERKSKQSELRIWDPPKIINIPFDLRLISYNHLIYLKYSGVRCPFSLTAISRPFQCSASHSICHSFSPHSVLCNWYKYTVFCRWDHWINLNEPSTRFTWGPLTICMQCNCKSFLNN